ncbi:MAG: PD40 domain-containing protein [Saprospiraceae bacterium]|nr:PD40 domain-containing protein [Saprospiraceae bacterium]
MMVRRVMMCLWIGIIASALYSQKVVPKNFEKAKKYLKEQKYQKSIDECKDIIQKSPSYSPVYKLIAQAYYTTGDKDNAIQYLIQAIELDGGEDFENYNSVATIQREMGDYEGAVKYYDKYLQKLDSTSSKYQKAQEYLKTCETRAYLKAHPVDFHPIRLEGAVNSDESEYMPSFTLDGQEMVFTRRTGNDEDLYFALLDSSGLYSEVLPFESINSSSNEGMQSISADGRVIFFTICDNRKTFGSCDIFYTVRESKGYTKPKNLGLKINSDAWDAQPSIAADGKRLYFSSRRKGGFGGSDIYVSYLNNRQWSEPVNLGPEINTSDDEESPFIHADGTTLYFRSNGHQGMGDFDIFKASFNPLNKSWSEVQNIGYPINTEANDGAFAVSLDGSKAYYASDALSRNQEGRPNLDILYFDLPMSMRPKPATYVRLFVSDFEGNSLSKVQCDLIDIETDSLIYSGMTNAAGEMLFAIVPGSNYLLGFNKQGYSYRSEHIQLDTVLQFSSPFEMSIVLDKIPDLDKKESPPIVLNNIFFDSGSEVLKPESNSEINYLYQLLHENPNVKIRILGHTDNVGQPVDNQKLSSQRAESVKNALIVKGIMPDRIQALGLGESQPIASNATEEGRKQNRRTEFVLVGSL